MRVVTILTIMSFLGSAANFAIYSTLAPLSKELGMGAREYAFATSLFLLFSSITLPAWGKIADKFDQRPFFILSNFLMLISEIVLLLAPNIGIYVEPALAGIASGSYPLLFTYVGRNVRDLEKAFGYISASSLLGSAFGSAIVLLLSPLANKYFLTYLSCLILTALSLPLPLLLPRGGEVKERRKGKIDRRVLTILTFDTIIAFGAAAGIWTFDFYLIKKYGVSLKEIAFLYLLESLLQALGSYVSPHVAERVGTLRTYFMFTIPATLLVLAISFTNDFALAYSLFILRTALMNAANPLLQALLAKLAPKEALGSVSSVNAVLWNLSGFFGKNVGGTLMTIDLEAPLRLTFVCYSFALTFLYLFLRSEVRSKGEVRFAP